MEEENLDLSKNIELNKVLKEFETKANIEEQIQNIKQETFKNSKTSKMVQWVIKYSGGIIKEQKQAEYVLFGFSLIILLVSFFFFWGGDKLFYKTESKEDAVQILGGSLK